jgi:hypothetical protein
VTERPEWSRFDVMAMKRIAFIQSSNVNKIVDAEELPIRLCNYVDVYYNDRITDKLAFSAGSATPREIEKFKLRPCDVVITKDSETPGDIAIPALVDASAAGVVCGYHARRLPFLVPKITPRNGSVLDASTRHHPFRFDA